MQRISGGNINGPREGLRKGWSVPLSVKPLLSIRSGSVCGTLPLMMEAASWYISETLESSLG